MMKEGEGRTKSLISRGFHLKDADPDRQLGLGTNSGFRMGPGRWMQDFFVNSQSRAKLFTLDS